MAPVAQLDPTKLYTFPSLSPKIPHGDATAAAALDSVQDLSLSPANGRHGAESGWNVRASEACLAFQNPIREITDLISAEAMSGKKTISMGAGDPTLYGHLGPPLEAVEAVMEALREGRGSGYGQSFGLLEARKAVAEIMNPELAHPLDPVEDIVITSGCGGALQVVMDVMCNRGRSNFLLPRPGYPLYETYCDHLGAEIRYYDLLPTRGWEVDCRQLAALADGDTAAIVLCNPGNPTGSVFSREHLQEIVATAAALRIPIISDEVYGGITFGGARFTPIGAVEGEGPIITVGSLSKKYLMPGWRLGWILLHDHAGHLARGKVQVALKKLMQFTPPASGPIQHAAAPILRRTPPAFFQRVNRELEAASLFCSDRIAAIHGLSCPSKPQGAMFVMIKIDTAAFAGIADDVDWCAKLLREESVVVIPGKAFNLPGYARQVSALPMPLLEEALGRIEAFCLRHAAK